MNNDFSLAGTKTAINLAKAFAGESQARMRYLLYSEKAVSEGYPTLGRIFTMTAEDERGHAEMFFDYLTKGLGKTTLQPQALVPAALGNTAQNLQSAAEAEHEEWTKIYSSFAVEAEAEGFKQVATSFAKIASIEKRHNARFMYLFERLTRRMLYSIPSETTWVCTNCGLHIKGRSAPDICPACHHPQKYFMTIYDGLYPLE